MILISILEWVPNLRTYKDIIMKEYDRKDIKDPNLSQLKNLNIETSSHRFSETTTECSIQRLKTFTMLELHSFSPRL